MKGKGDDLEKTQRGKKKAPGRMPSERPARTLSTDTDSTKSVATSRSRAQLPTCPLYSCKPSFRQQNEMGAFKQASPESFTPVDSH